MINLNTNLSSLITQNSLKQSTNRLNIAIERMTTGFKINHAKDNAANYDIVTKMNTKVGSLEVAEDNTETAIDVITTASDSLNIIEDRLQRLRALQEQALNGTYGEESLQALNLECNSLVDEIERLYVTTKFNGINMFIETSDDGSGNQIYEHEVSADINTKFEELGISDTSIEVFDISNTKLATIDITESESIGDLFQKLETYGFSSEISYGQITLESNNGNYVSGALANELGIGAQDKIYVESTTATFVPEVSVINTITTVTTETTTSVVSSTYTNTVNQTTTVTTINTVVSETVSSGYVARSDTLYLGGTVANLTTDTPNVVSVDENKRISKISSFTEGETYYVSTTEDLIALKNLSSTDFGSGSFFEQTADIDMRGIDWTGILNFDGTYNGNNYKISNLKGNSGLFQKLHGDVYNVNIDNCDLVSNSDLGAISNYYSSIGSKILNCGVTGNINCLSTGTSDGVGGLIGFSGDGSCIYIESCDINAVISSNGASAGGLIGYFSEDDMGEFCDIKNCRVLSISPNLNGVFIGKKGSSVALTVSNNTYNSQYDSMGLSATTYGTAQDFTTTSAKVVEGTALEDIGATSDGLFLGGYNEYSWSTIGDLIEKINSHTDMYGHTYEAQLIEGVLTITRDDGGEIEGLDYYILGQIGMTQSSNPVTTTIVTTQTLVEEKTTTTEVVNTVLTTTTATTTNTEIIYTTSIITVSGATTFDQLGINSPISVTVIQAGTQSRFSLDLDTTFNEFYNFLESYEITVIEDPACVTLTGRGNSYINSSNIESLIGLSPVVKNNGVTKENTKSDNIVYFTNIEGIYAPGKINLQVGVCSDSNSVIEADISFKITGLQSLRGIGEGANDYLKVLDELLNRVSNKQVEFGAIQNRLLSVLEEISIKKENLISSRSTLRDADISEVSSMYIQQQILQQASATLMATANQSPSIALQLIL